MEIIIKFTCCLAYSVHDVFVLGA